MILQTPLGPFAVYPTGTITRALQAGQWWDVHLKPILDEADPSGWAIDVGAHIGWFTVYLAQRHARVIAVEPYPESFALLTENVQAQSVEVKCRIQCWAVAAYSHPALLHLDARSDQTDAGAFGFTEAVSVGPAVCGLALDDYLPETARITVIKCDAQGADLRALTGCLETIRRCRPLIVFEWEDTMAAWHGDTWFACIQFFTRLNYTVDRITPDFWDYVARPR